METTPHLIDPRQAGELLRMLPARVVRLAKRGDIPCVALPNGEYRFVFSELEQWIAAHRRPARTVSEGDHDG
jgi:hypothetical protein